MCHATPTLETRRSDGTEVIEGVFRCVCGVKYPIIGGVPRMLPPQLQSGLEDDYPDFFRSHPDLVLAGSGAARSRDAVVKRNTQEAFGYEWTWAADYHAVNFSDWLPTGLEANALFADKVGLEVGCGAGRHAALTSSIAKQHFAVDLSRAVDSAFALNRNTTNCHIVQADAFHLPFRPGTFDYVYCLGVLQHMPDPVAGFYALAEQPRESGTLLVNVYQASRPVTLFLLEMARQVTIRLPNVVLKYLSYAAGCVDYGLFIAPWRAMSGTSLGRAVERFVPERIREYAKHDFHTCVTDWFDRLSCPVKKHYRQEDMEGWYRKAGYSEISVTPYWKAFWNGFGRRSHIVRLHTAPSAVAVPLSLGAPTRSA
jgi:SAM-dependent methyltransferase/uncharacterized protein YbaR (Trm112 family)